MKYILIIGDGMADNPLEAFGNITALEKSNIPEIDALAAAGRFGTARTIPVGFPPGSDTGILSIMGCDTKSCYKGRAPLEAAAQGVILPAGSAAFRCNCVSFSDAEKFEDRLILSHCGGGIEGELSEELMHYLFAHPDFAPHIEKASMSIKPTKSYRHLVFRDNANIEGIVMHPPHDHLGEKVGDNLPTGCADTEILIDLMRRAVPILDAHPINIERKNKGEKPANGIWFWAEGTAATLPNFYELFGKTGAVISAVPLCHGIARLMGLDVILVEGATGELETNYEGKVDAAVSALSDYDFVTVHVEAPDECSHAKDPDAKVLAIEYLSKRVVGAIVNKMNASGEDYRMLIISDHKTLLIDGSHNEEPVPFIIYDSRENEKNGCVYTEDCAEGREHIDDGQDLMRELFSQ